MRCAERHIGRDYAKELWTMLFDALIAALITVVAIILGLTVHPVLFFIVALAVVYLVSRMRMRGGHRVTRL
jgi:hypothetical protein